MQKVSFNTIGRISTDYKYKISFVIDKTLKHQPIPLALKKYVICR
jgi:hypothetical protein